MSFYASYLYYNCNIILSLAKKSAFSKNQLWQNIMITSPNKPKQSKTSIKLQKYSKYFKSWLIVIILNVDFINGKKGKLMTKKLLKLLLLVSLNSAAEKAPQTGREKAMAKLLAALPSYLQRADLGRIKIEPSGDGTSFTTEIFYKYLIFIQK